MAKPEPLLCGQHYHIYNRGNSGQVLFREQRNHPYFLKLYARYIEPIAETYAYCLMSNHFHFLVWVRDEAQDRQSSKDCRSYEASQAFANLFGTYTKAFNKAYERTGSLFERPFRRRLVDNDRHFAYLVVYIHRNPQKHGFVEDYRRWPYSSYQAILSDRPSRVQRRDVLEWFGGRAGFERGHVTMVDETIIEPLIHEDRNWHRDWRR